MQAAPGATRVVLVGVDLGAAGFDPTLDELAQLAQSAGDAPVARIVARRRAPDAALFVGSGKADEIKAAVEAGGAAGVIFDQALSPVQQRNLERHLGVAVSDRTGLILDIFADRARSHEGKLQVELARLQYLATRLVRRWTHLERQSGGIGQRGGPGETQIELDRRMIGERIKSVSARLERVKRQRATQRRARERGGVFRISLVGYTNAGKSTLFNALAKARALAADQLFATLDTTTRALWLGDAAGSASLSDTVGFVRDLPHKLVEAFEATLQEAADADLLRRRPTPTCCCTWSTRRARTGPSRSATWSACSPRSAPPRSRRSSCSTSATCSSPTGRRAGRSTGSSGPTVRVCAGSSSAPPAAPGWSTCASCWRGRWKPT